MTGSQEDSTHEVEMVGGPADGETFSVKPGSTEIWVSRLDIVEEDELPHTYFYRLEKDGKYHYYMG